VPVDELALNLPHFPKPTRRALGSLWHSQPSAEFSLCVISVLFHDLPG
jgi:hypothetical protein